MQSVLSNDEIRRYSRHLILPGVGLSGQRKLKDASVLCIGAGGLGSPLSMYLAAAGVGQIGLVDFDVVDYSNLQRQILYTTDDVGRSKTDVAVERLQALNREIEIIPYDEPLTSANAVKICKDYDIIADGTDNFPTRYLTNDVSVLLDKPNVYTSIFRFEGQASIFHAEEGPCYRCLYPEPPPPGIVPNCAEGGVIGVLPGIMGAIQASEVIKLIIGYGEPLVGRLLLFNALSMRMREVEVVKDPSCPICGESPIIHELVDYQQFCGINTIQQDHLEEKRIISPVELFKELRSGRKITLLDVRDSHEWEICHLPNAKLVPEPLLLRKLSNLDKDSNIILYCRTGIRSARALKTLRGAGFKNLKHLEGGLHAWSDSVDPSFPKY